MGHWSTTQKLEHHTFDDADLVPIPVTRQQQRDAIDGFCNRTLWPALHGLIDNIEQLDGWRAAYGNRSRRTAQLIAEQAEQNSIVWLHDYHHFGVAAPLRERRPDLKIGLFCHTPVDAGGLMVVAGCSDLAQGLAGNDLIATQTERDAEGMRNLFSVCEVESPPVVKAIPVGFDAERWLSLRTDTRVRALARSHRAPKGILAIGVDRADYTKGLVHKLLAIELLLDAGAIDADRFRLVQIAVPTRTNVPSYQFLARQLTDITERINEQFPRRDGRPTIDLRMEQVSPVEVAALMRAADLALVTPVRDGMNLVALEFSVLNGDRSAEMILGEGAGAAQHIGPWCDTVDATDVLAVAAAIRSYYRSNRMDRARRSRRRAEAAIHMSSRNWAEAFLTELDAAAHNPAAYDRTPHDRTPHDRTPHDRTPHGISTLTGAARTSLSTRSGNIGSTSVSRSSSLRHSQSRGSRGESTTTYLR